MSRIEIEKFNGNNNFRLWSIKMCTCLQPMAKALNGNDKLSKMMKEVNKLELTEKIKGIILLNSLDEV